MEELKNVIHFDQTIIIDGAINQSRDHYRACVPRLKGGHLENMMWAHSKIKNLVKNPTENIKIPER